MRRGPDRHTATATATAAAFFFPAIRGLSPDRCFGANRAQARREDRALIGAYAVLRPGDVAAQARSYRALLGRLGPSESFVLGAQPHGGWAPSGDDVATWATVLGEAEPGPTRLIRCSRRFWDDIVGAAPAIARQFDGLCIHGGPIVLLADGAAREIGTEQDLRNLTALRKDRDMFTDDDRNLLTYVSQLLTELKSGFAQIDPAYDWHKGLAAFAGNQRLAHDAASINR